MPRFATGRDLRARHRDRAPRRRPRRRPPRHGARPAAARAHLRARRPSGWRRGPAGSPSASVRATASSSPCRTATRCCSCASPCRGPGGVPAPVNAQMRPDEIAHVVADSGADVVLRTDGRASPAATPLDEAVTGRPDDLAALFYTSGTTGKPEGRRAHPQGARGSLTAGGAVAVAAAPGRGGAVACRWPTSWASPACWAWPRPASPSTSCRRSGPRPCSTPSRAGGPRIFVGVPAMYRMLLEAGAERRDLSSVRVWSRRAPTSCHRTSPPGSSAWAPTASVFGRPGRRGGLRRGLRHGRVGGGAAVRFSPPGFSAAVVDGVGMPLPGYRFKVVDDDGREVAARRGRRAAGEGPRRARRATTATPRPRRRPSPTTAGCAPATSPGAGPLGGVVFAGRKKDVIMHGGYSVYAVEVEEALEAHPDVLEAAVVGLPDERKGEVPVAAVRLRPGSSTTPEHLIGWAAEQLSDYKAPRRIVVVDELPRTGTTRSRSRSCASCSTSSRAVAWSPCHRSGGRVRRSLAGGRRRGGRRRPSTGYWRRPSPSGGYRSPLQRVLEGLVLGHPAHGAVPGRARARGCRRPASPGPRRSRGAGGRRHGPRRPRRRAGWARPARWPAACDSARPASNTASTLELHACRGWTGWPARAARPDRSPRRVTPSSTACRGLVLRGTHVVCGRAPALPSRRGQARPRRARPGRQGHRPGPARRRLRGHLHRPAPDPRAGGRDRAPGGRRRRRPLASSPAPT